MQHHRQTYQDRGGRCSGCSLTEGRGCLLYHHVFCIAGCQLREMLLKGFGWKLVVASSSSREDKKLPVYSTFFGQKSWIKIGQKIISRESRETQRNFNERYRSSLPRSKLPVSHRSTLRAAHNNAKRLYVISCWSYEEIILPNKQIIINFFFINLCK